jgi:hypothetical protein
VTNRTGWTNLRAQTAVHAFADVDVEVRKLALFGLLVHIDTDGDTGDRTDALASQAAGADIQIDFEDSTVTERQGVLNWYWDLIRVLNRHRPSHQVREGD